MIRASLFSLAMAAAMMSFAWAQSNSRHDNENQADHGVYHDDPDLGEELPEQNDRGGLLNQPAREPAWETDVPYCEEPGRCLPPSFGRGHGMYPRGAGHDMYGSAMQSAFGFNSILGTWWEVSPGGVVRQIELHPSRVYSEVIYHRSGIRLDVVIGSFIADGTRLSVGVAGLPQRQWWNRPMVVGGRWVQINYLLGSSGPDWISYLPHSGQLVLTDPSGVSRVWTRYPPPVFGGLAYPQRLHTAGF